MTRVLRYPRLCAVMCVLTIFCAVLRDACVSASLDGCAQVLLYATFLLLPVCLVLMSCRFIVDSEGVGVGVLLRVRRTPWAEIASLGILHCNSRRRYLYGMYRGHTDFLNLLHHAPACGPWGFVVPMDGSLLQSVCHYCPFEMDLSPLPSQSYAHRLRTQWRHAAMQTMLMLPAALAAFAAGALLLLSAVRMHHNMTVFALTLCALLLMATGVSLLYRMINTISICPAFSEEGVRAGRGLYLSWQDVRFGYVHRIAHMSGMYLLSRPQYEMQRRGAPPVICLSMPDTSTLLLAYLTYCPHAEKGITG